MNIPQEALDAAAEALDMVAVSYGAASDPETWSGEARAAVSAAVPHIREQIANEIRHKTHADGYDKPSDWTLGMGDAANLTEGKMQP